MRSYYETRTITWFQGRRWALFRNHLGISTCLFTAATEAQCEDYLRTMIHQRRLPKGELYSSELYSSELYQNEVLDA